MALSASVRFNSLLFALSLFSILGLLNLLSYSRLPQIDENHQQTTNVHSLTGRTSVGKGMVMCVGNDASLIAGALYTIQQLRKSWKSTLPVSVNHCNELSIDTQSLFTKFHNVTVENICDNNTPKIERKRLKGWFCKTRALIISKFDETLVVDTDVLWFKDPTQLFNAPAYLATGALFFRDRFLYVSSNEADGLEVEKVSRLIEFESNNVIKIDNTSAKVFSESNGINFFWRHSANISNSKAIRHVQESSVIVFNANRLPRTILVLSRLLHNFRQGYGDKEIYWIAATIAGENFSFEPFLAGSYGDCGEILHFDPLSVSPEAAPYFLNCQYIADGLGKVGKNLQNVISKPVLATTETKLFNMGEKDRKSAGRCGSCIAMGCGPVPPGVNEAILEYQQFIIDHTRQTLFFTIYRRVQTFFENFLDS